MYLARAGCGLFEVVVSTGTVELCACVRVVSTSEAVSTTRGERWRRRIISGQNRAILGTPGSREWSIDEGMCGLE